MHWPATLHGFTLATGTVFLAQIPPTGTLFILYRNGVFGEYLGIGLGSSILAGSLDASPLPSLIIIFLCGQASEKQGK